MNWNPEHENAFKDLKEKISDSTSLAFPKVTHAMCLFTDASENFWSAVLVQTESEKMDTPVQERQYEPLAFLSGAFKNSAINWSVPEKEGFAIVEAMTKLDYLTMGRRVYISTDHANLLQLYDPENSRCQIPRYAMNKMMRWATKLSAFNYVIEHIPGDQNVWAYMLSRWVSHQSTAIRAERIRLGSLVLAPVSPNLSDDYDWPTLSEIRSVQPKIMDDKQWNIGNGIWRNSKAEMFVPDDENKLKIRLLIAAHAGMSGHRAKDITLSNLSSSFWWKTRDQDVQSFVDSCLHCISTSSGEKVPRPLGHALHATTINEVLHFDYCWMGPSDVNEKYILVIKDDLSSYIWLMPTISAHAVTTAECLNKWFAAFGTVSTWVSDKGSHFLNETIREIAQLNKNHHHFTLAYCPWSNGTVEVVCRELQRATRAILHEFQLPAKMWRTTVSIVQGALNNSKLKRLHNKCPMEIFTGHPQDSPVSSIATSIEGATVVK